MTFGMRGMLPREKLWLQSAGLRPRGLTASCVSLTTTLFFTPDNPMYGSVCHRAYVYELFEVDMVYKCDIGCV